jgi:hypothetical protein
MSAHRALLIGAVPFLCVAGCGFSSVGTYSGTVATVSGTGSGTTTTTPPTGLGGGAEGGAGSHDTISSTLSVAGVVSVVVGAKQTLSITFTSSDGRAMSGFGISNSLGSALPAGWTGPTTFGCAAVSTGSGCVLNLVYAPTAYDSGGTVMLDYVYIDNDMEPQTTGSLTFSYQATTNDNVVAAAAPMGQINATLGAGSQTVVETFTTDDGFPASGFAITSDLAALPPGWSTPGPLACATVSAGTPCQLPLTYAPTAPASGTLTLNYAFNDDSGTPKTASFNVPYAATANNNVQSSLVPASPISVVAGMGASQTVTVTFATDDGFSASDLTVTSDLTALPEGFSAAPANFACATVSAGVPCVLNLTYTPVAAGDNATLQLTYQYFDNAGVGKTGSVNLAYSST